MEIKLKLNLLLFSIVFVTSVANALECKEAQLSPYFGNGMFNSRRDAEASRAELEVKMVGIPLIGVKERIFLAYNVSEKPLEQLLQVTNQKDAEAGRKFWRWLANLSQAPRCFREMAENAGQRVDQEAYQNDDDLRAQVTNYSSDLFDGKVVVVVPHSQGNFYANSAWHLLQQPEKYKKRFSIVGVATPVTYIAGDGAYSTLTQDKIMWAVRREKEGALPANITNSTATGSGHLFVSDYLNGDVSGPKIMKDLRAAIGKLKSEFGGPTDSALEYQDESLWPFMRYTCMLQSTKPKLTDGECIALTALDRTYAWFGEDRDERSLKSLNAWIDECDDKENWHNSTRFDFLQCSILGSPPSMDPRGSGSNELSFVKSDHPECNWRNEEVGRHTGAAAVAEARALLKSPPRIRK